MNIYYQANDGSIRSLGDNELAHFNQNHDAMGRFAKSGIGKVVKYEKKAQKAYLKSAKFQIKAAKKAKKANRKERRMMKGKGGDQSVKINRYRSHANSYEYKAAKYIKKKSKYEKKARKWAEKINKKVGDKPLTDLPVSSLSSREIYAGRKYAVKFVG